MDLREAHVHDFDNACGKRCLDYELDVFEVNGFAVDEIVCCFVVVANAASVDFV